MVGVSGVRMTVTAAKQLRDRTAELQALRRELIETRERLADEKRKSDNCIRDVTAMYEARLAMYEARLAEALRFLDSHWSSCTTDGAAVIKALRNGAEIPRSHSHDCPFCASTADSADAPPDDC